jgi:hypothetical protein
LVADPDELCPTRRLSKVLERFGHGRSGEIHPSDDPCDELVPRGEREEFDGLLEARACLNDDCPVDAAGAKQWLEIIRPERLRIGASSSVIHG